MIYFERYLDIHLNCSGIWRILKKLHMKQLPSNQRDNMHEERWKRYEKSQPGHRILVDLKFLKWIAGTRKKYYQYAVIDD